MRFCKGGEKHNDSNYIFRILAMVYNNDWGVFFISLDNIRQQSRLVGYISVTEQRLFKLPFLLFYDIVLAQKYYGYS
jgi:hypothetical protein